MKHGYKLIIIMIIIMIIVTNLISFYSVRASTSKEITFPVVDGYSLATLLYCPYDNLKINIDFNVSYKTTIELHIISEKSIFQENITESSKLIVETGIGPVYILIVVHTSPISGGQGWMRVDCQW